MFPLDAITNLVPSADEATQNQSPPGTLFDAQVNPEFVEVETMLSATATNLVPSAEDATENQKASGALVFVQVVPEFIEA